MYDFYLIIAKEKEWSLILNWYVGYPNVLMLCFWLEIYSACT